MLQLSDGWLNHMHYWNMEWIFTLCGVPRLLSLLHKFFRIYIYIIYLILKEKLVKEISTYSEPYHDIKLIIIAKFSQWQHSRLDNDGKDLIQKWNFTQNVRQCSHKQLRQGPVSSPIPKCTQLAELTYKGDDTCVCNISCGRIEIPFSVTKDREMATVAIWTLLLIHTTIYAYVSVVNWNYSWQIGQVVAI